MITGLPDQVAAAAGHRLNADPLRPDESARVLTWGIDTLYVAIDITWHPEPVAVGGGAVHHKRPGLFDRLDAAKERAREQDLADGEPVEIDGPSQWGPFIGNVAGYGIGGYGWVIRGRDMTWKLGGWMTPGSKPSLLIEFRSEALWRHSARVLMVYVREIIQRQGGRVEGVKVSRGDLAVDILIPEGTIDRQTEGHIVSRVDATGTKSYRRRVNAVEVGFGGALLCRIYDKPLEIRQRNDTKAWFYDVWGVGPELPVGHAVFRVEFQLRREVLKELGVGDAEAFLVGAGEVWSHCSQKWLRFVDRPDVKRGRQRLLPWWAVVQSGWRGERSRPAERVRASCGDQDQLSRQILGCFTSLLALLEQEKTPSESGPVSIAGELPRLIAAAAELGKTPEVVGDEVRRKLAKYRSTAGQFDRVIKRRLLDRGRLFRLIDAPTDRRTLLDDQSAELAKRFYDRLLTWTPDDPAPGPVTQAPTVSPPVAKPSRAVLRRRQSQGQGVLQQRIGV